MDSAPPSTTLPDFRTRTGLLQLAAAMLVLSAIAVAFDLPIASLLRERIPGELRRLLTWSELFAHGLGVALIAAMIAVLAPTQRRLLPQVLATAWGAGLVADGCKLLIGRYRPSHKLPEHITESFAGWLPVVFPISGHARFDHAVQSFPSAHTAVATGMAIALTALYPHGRWLFAGFAVLAACQRVQSGAHYPSDTLAGAAVGFAVAAWVVPRLKTKQVTP